MSQFDRAPPRFSRRQVTKRKFNILGSPNILQNVETNKSNRIDTETNKTDAEISRIGSQRKNKLKPQQSVLKPQELVSTRKKARTGESSLQNTETYTLKENAVGRDLFSSEVKDSPKNHSKGESTPKNQHQGLADDTQTPGDVSVTFLASTPKPGRPQLSRRRPMSPVGETSRSEIQNGKEFKENSVRERLKRKPNVSSPRKQSLPREQLSPWKLSSQRKQSSPRKQSPQKRAAGASIDELIASANKSRLENKRKNNEIHKKVSENNVSNNTDRSRSSEVESSSSRATDSVKKQSMSVKDIPLRNRHSTINSVNAGSNSKLGSRVAGMGNESSMRYRTYNKSKNVQTSTQEADDTHERLEKGKKVSASRIDRNVTSNENDVTVRNASARVSSSNQRKLVVNRKLQAQSRKEDSLCTTLPDQTVVMWENEGQKRTRTDLLDLDVILNMMTETLDARMDVYDTDEEQSAVRLLEKYLTQDITHMINGVQKVADLQSKIKKSGQSIKQKQKSLMALQKERVELEEKCLPGKKIQEKNKNIAAINQFLRDLSKVIDMC